MGGRNPKRSTLEKIRTLKEGATQKVAKTWSGPHFYSSVFTASRSFAYQELTDAIDNQQERPHSYRSIVTALILNWIDERVRFQRLEKEIIKAKAEKELAQRQKEKKWKARQSKSS